MVEWHFLAYPFFMSILKNKHAKSFHVFSWNFRRILNFLMTKCEWLNRIYDIYKFGVYICRLNKNYCCQCWDVLYRSPHTRKDNVTKIDHNVNPWYQNNTRFIDGVSLISIISLEVSLQLLNLESTTTFIVVRYISCNANKITYFW